MYELLLCVSDRTASILYSVYIIIIHTNVTYYFYQATWIHMHNEHADRMRISLNTNTGNS